MVRTYLAHAPGNFGLGYYCLPRSRVRRIGRSRRWGRDYKQVGQRFVIGYNLLLVRPPGAGKTMLARRLAAVLPPLTRDEVIEASTIWSVAGLLPRSGALMYHRPVRAPHHTISVSGLIGGGSPPHPGEVTLAHLGVLFLDELRCRGRFRRRRLRP